MVAKAVLVCALAGTAVALATTSAPAPVTRPVAAPSPERLETAAVPAGAYHVSPSGSDAGSGSATQPWRTLTKAASSAKPGDTVVVRSGTYGARGTVTAFNTNATATAPITIMGHPGEAKPVVLGQVRVQGSHNKLRGFVFDGPTGPVVGGTASSKGGEDVQVWLLYGTGIELSDSVIRNNKWHAGIHVYSVKDAQIIGNRIHDNGDRGNPANANLDHGVYWDGGTGVLANNIIENNVSWGVQVYPKAAGVTVKHNTIVGNDKGGVIVGDGSDMLNTKVANNIITGNLEGFRAYNVAAGSGTELTNNLIWGNTTNIASTTNVNVTGTITANPLFTSSTNYHLQSGSPAIDRGLASYGIGYDFDRVARPQGAGPDLGAFETGGRERSG